jgi:hypothetical protein
LGRARLPLAPLLAPARPEARTPATSKSSPPRCWRCRPWTGRG